MVLVIALFILTWQTFEPKLNKDLEWSRNLKDYSCEITDHIEFFDDEMKALVRQTVLEKDEINIRIKLYDAIEKKSIGNYDEEEIWMR